MGSKSAPDAPDYTGAAEAQGASSKENLTQQTTANRPTQITPWGTSKWTSSAGTDPSSGQAVTNWEQNITLSPSEQAAFDSQSRIRAGQSGAAEALLGQAADAYATPTDYTKFNEWGAAPDVSGLYRDLETQRGTGPELPSQIYDRPEKDWGQGVNAESKVTSALSRGSGPNVSNEAVTSDYLRSDLPTAPASAVKSDFGFGASPTVQQSALIGVKDFAKGPEVGDIGEMNTSLSSGNVEDQRTNEMMGQSLNATGGYQDRFGNTQFDRQMSLQGPQMEQEREALDVSLRNQGLTPGTEAYDRAIKQQRDQQGEQMSRMAQDSLYAGANEQQRQFDREKQTREQGLQELTSDFSREMQSEQFKNSTRGQEFAEAQTRDAQRFDKELRAAGFSDGQRQQMISQRLADNEQQFAQQLAKGKFDNERQAQSFSQNLAGDAQMFGQQAQVAEMSDARRGADIAEQLASREQMFGQQLAAGQYADDQRGDDINQQLAAGQQYYDQNMSSADQRDRQRNLDYEQRLGAGNQIFNQQMTQAEYADKQRADEFNELNTGLNTMFNQQNSTANYQNQLRQAQIAEERGMRGQSVNEINALLYGNQISQPNMPGFTNAGVAEATQYGQAAANQGQFANQRYATALGPVNSTIGAVGQWAGAN